MDYSVEIPKLRAEGKTYSEIIALTGAARSTVAYYCGDNQREKTTARTLSYVKEIRRYINYVKENTPCEDCGKSFPYYVMHHDHLPGFVKLFNISSFKEHTKDIEVVKREMGKCDVVCANCHAERSHRRSLAAKDVDDLYLDELD